MQLSLYPSPAPQSPAQKGGGGCWRKKIKNLKKKKKRGGGGGGEGGEEPGGEEKKKREIARQEKAQSHKFTKTCSASFPADNCFIS